MSITDNDTTQTLHDALSVKGAALMVQAMTTLQAQGTLTAVHQDEQLVTYAHKLEKSEAAIDWQKSAIEISRQVRAFNPFPVAQSLLNGEICRIWMATAMPATANQTSTKPGEIISVQDGLLVACGSGVLKIAE